MARPIYEKAIGHLLAPKANWTAALTFYFFYVTICWYLCVRSTEHAKEAAQKGALLGGVCYGVYELTNWAVLRDWPAYIVPIDWGWGIVLTSASTGLAHLISRRLG